MLPPLSFPPSSGRNEHTGGSAKGSLRASVASHDDDGRPAGEPEDGGLRRGPRPRPHRSGLAERAVPSSLALPRLCETPRGRFGARVPGRSRERNRGNGSSGVAWRSRLKVVVPIPFRRRTMVAGCVTRSRLPRARCGARPAPARSSSAAAIFTDTSGRLGSAEMPSWGGS